MQAVYAAGPRPDDPLAALAMGDMPEPQPLPGWTVVTVHSASLNHHDLWTLRGAGLPADRYPMILGCDASGTDESGREVVVLGTVCAPEWRHDPVRDLRHTALSEGAPGTFGERVAVPLHCLVPKPAEFSHPEAACLPATWLTAYRMLFTKARVTAGDTVLIQGASGGVSTALTHLAVAAGVRVWVTGRTEEKRKAALARGAHACFRPGHPLPTLVDAVMETVGRTTWSHSLRSVRPGGTVVVTGATTGADPVAHLNRIFWQEIRILGSTGGTPQEFDALLSFMRLRGLRPEITAELPFSRAEEGFRRMLAGEVSAKIVFSW